MKIDCLYCHEAVQGGHAGITDTAVSQHFEEQGLPPSGEDAGTVPYHERTDSLYIRYAKGYKRQSSLEGQGLTGPYCTAYPAFIDCYRLLARMAERVDFSSVLLCCTLLDSKGSLWIQAESF